MNIKTIFDAIGRIKDNIICGVKPSTVRFKKMRFMLISCFALLITISILSLTSLFSERQDKIIGEDYTYQVVEYEVPASYSVAPLYMYSVVPDKDICAALDNMYPGIDCSYALHVFKFEGDEPNAKQFWIPVFNNSGRITHFIYVSKLLVDERITFGSSNSDVDMIQALSSTTAADAPMYLAADNDCLYFIIGDNAYSMSPLAKDGAKLPDIMTSGLDIVTIILPLE